MIENNDKTLEIISEEEIDKYINSMTRNMVIPFSALEDALKIFESLGCGKIKLVSYYCLSKKGFLLIAENGRFGIKLKELPSEEKN